MYSELVFFEEINNKKVFTILSSPNKENGKRIVIMSHGFRSSSVGPARTFVDFSRKLNSEGFYVLRFDQLNSGNSEGDYVDSSFKEWVSTIVYFATEFLDKGYQVGLLGQSMGATATMIATNQEQIRGKIPRILLWVPDPKTDFNKDSSRICEENGQKYKNEFWQEAKEMDFFDCLKSYTGAIHLVYGEKDRFVSRELREETISKVKEKGQKVMILPGQDHSPWDFDVAQMVYDEETSF